MLENEEQPIVYHPKAWLRRARSDLALARHAIQAEDVLPEDAAYHVQQCAEKALKAALLQQAGQFPFVHDLDFLIEQLEDSEVIVPAVVQRAGELTQYAVQTRYPGDWEPVSVEEVQEKIELAAQILGWVSQFVQDVPLLTNHSEL